VEILFDDLVMHALVWLRRVRFGVIQSGVSYANLRQPVLFKAKFKVKIVLHLNKYGIYVFFLDICNISCI